MKNAYLYCFVLFLCLACEDQRVYRSQHLLTKQVWSATAAQQFKFHIGDHTQAYDIILLVSNHINYPYQNLFVTYELKDEQAQSLASGLKDCQIFEAKTGKPLGRGWHHTKKHQFILLPAYQFQQPGNYQLELAQFMRTDELEGIEAIGIQINKATAKT